MTPDELPFEYGRRWTELHEPMGVDVDNAAYMEERDRQLEDYLASIGGAGAGKLPFYVAASDASDASKALSDYVCTGTNDEVVIQAAVDAIEAYQANSGTPYFLPVSAPLWLSEGSFFLSTQVVISGVSAGGPSTGPFKILGRGSAQTFLQAVGTSKTIDCFQSSPSDSGGLSAYGLAFHDFDFALRGASGGTDVTDGTSIVGCRFEDCAGVARFYTASNFAVVDNEVYRCTSGVDLDVCSSGVISGNRFVDTTGSDITASELTDTAIAGNTSTAAGASFLALTAAVANVAITGNVVDDSAAAAINVNSGVSANISGLTITGNLISNGSTNSALYVGGAAASPVVVVVGNSLDGTVSLDVDALLTSNNITGSTSGSGSISGVQASPSSVLMTTSGGGSFYLDGTLMQLAIGTGQQMEFSSNYAYFQDSTGNAYVYVDPNGVEVSALGVGQKVNLAGPVVTMFGATGIDGTATPSTAAQLADVLVDLGVIASHTIP